MLNHHFSPYPVLITERLLLRQLTADDAEAILTLRSDAVVNKYIDRPACSGKNEALHFIRQINDGISNHISFYWAITLKTKDELIGTICLWNIAEEKQMAETGFELMPAYQGKGIMHEALKAVLDFAFNKINLQVITAFCMPENTGSRRLLVRNNFQQDKENRLVSKEEAGKLLVYYLEKEKWSF